MTKMIRVLKLNNLLPPLCTGFSFYPLYRKRGTNASSKISRRCARKKPPEGGGVAADAIRGKVTQPRLHRSVAKHGNKKTPVAPGVFFCRIDDFRTIDSRRGKCFCLAFIILWQAQDCKEILAGKRAYTLSAQRSTSTPEVVPSAAYCGVTLQPRASPRKRSGTMVRLSLLMYGAASMVCGVPLTV